MLIFKNKKRVDNILQIIDEENAERVDHLNDIEKFIDSIKVMLEKIYLTVITIIVTDD
jgi:hypothetical protein